MRKGLAILSAIALTCFCLFSCKPEDNPPGPPSPPPGATPAPTISSFVIADICSRTVVITGTNFNADLFKDSVFFGNQKGFIDSATTTRLVVRYPAGNPSGNITVYSNGRPVSSADIFSVPVVTIASFAPATAGPGALITITGQHFNPDISTDSVFIDALRAEVVSASPTQIIARVPQTVASGLIRVHTNCQVATSSGPFTFSNKGIVFASSNDGICYAIDITSHTALWTVPTNSKYFCGPSYANGIVYIGSSDVNVLSNNYLYALDATSGREIWKYNAGPYDGIPVIHQGVVYAGGFDKKLMAFNAATGIKLWEFTGGDYFRSASPTYYDDKIFIRNDDGHLYCVNATTGSLVWRNMIWPGGNPAIVDGIVYSAGSGMFYALDANTGNTVWSLPVQYMSGSSPTIVGNLVYIAGENHQIYALNRFTGAIVWQLEASWWVASALIVADNILFVHCGDGVIGGVNATTGTLIWSKALPASGLPGACPLVANGVLYVGDDSGNLNALNAATGATLWTFKLGAYPMISSPCVVDPNGEVHYAGDSGNQQ